MRSVKKSFTLIDLNNAYGEWEASEIQSGVTPRLDLWRLAFKSLFGKCSTEFGTNHQSVTMARYYILRNIRLEQGEFFREWNEVNDGKLFGNNVALLRHKEIGD